MSHLLVQLRPGLGDNLICVGIIREYAKRYDSVSLLCLPRNYATVSFLYRDVGNITVIKVEEADTDTFIARERVNYTEVKRIGFEGLHPDGGNWEKQFYKMAGVDYLKKWSGFSVARDQTREETLFHKVAPNGDYIFLHEDRPRNYRIERKLIHSPYPVTEPSEKLTENLLDYCGLLERAKEIHVIDSSFMYLVDLLPYDNPAQKLFVHRYARENMEWKLPILRKNWNIVTLPHRRTGWRKPLWNMLDSLETFLLYHSLTKRATRALYRRLHLRTRSQRTAASTQDKM